ncbi:MAG: hypothetical protein HY782_11700 [Chloroflexi bacterium]|nr:hypothetical protein [Chloroflexota bacterium]
MVSLPPELAAKVEHAPNAPVDLIVRVKDDPSAHVHELESLGWIVRRTFSLTPSVAIKGPASASLALANKNWVLAIEEDKPVHTM